MKFNPFQPNGMVAPGMFAGRIEEIDAIEQCLFQAKMGNPQHFLISGERGIGKSSLFYLIEIIASGAIETSENTKMAFLTVSVDLGGAQTQIDIIRTFGRGLRAAISERDGLHDKAKQFWEWITNWEVLGVRFHKQADEIDPQDLADELVSQIISLCKQLDGQIDGVLILIDEADRPGEEANLGELLKAFTERLARKNCGNVLFGLAGLPTIIGKLRGSHESAPRIFETLHLEPLEPEERKRVVDSGLEIASKRNGFEIRITPDALDLISTLSEGYPHFVQQFAYSAFSEDKDRVIDIRDVANSAFKENGALAQLGAKYFSEMYHAKISSDDYRKVLDVMANYSDAWVTRKTIISETGLKSTTVTNALNSLKGKNIILVDETRQGHYRLPTKSFATWINAIKTVADDHDDQEGNLFEDL
jgi:hypothetical protein